MKRIRTALMTALLSCLSHTQASAEPFSLGVKGSTLGAGIETQYRINPMFSVVGSVNGIGFDASTSTKDLSISGKIRMLTIGGSLGVHPFSNSFKLLLGVFYNGNQLDISEAHLKNAVTVGGITVTPAQFGQAKMKVHYNRLTPYVGVGFDTPLCDKSSWSMTGELGILFQISPKAQISRNGSGGFPQVRRFLEKEVERTAQNKVLLTYFPVIAVGLKYGF
jgi:hypothetical protein